VEKPEIALMEKHGITNLTVEAFRALGVQETLGRIQNQLADCDMIYVSFDVDSMDPSISRGTGTPVPGGLDFEEALELNVALAALEKVKAWEMVEINPLLDTENAMAKHAYEILKPVLQSFKEK
jgi:arginase